MAKDWKRISKELWPHLVEMAQKGKPPVIYKEAASWVGTNALSIGPKCLAHIQNFCKENDYPKLTSLVVGKNNGLPGHGFYWGEYANASDSKKREHLKELHKEVYEFDWDSVDYSPTEKAEEVRLESFVEFARLLDGRELKTPRQNKKFVVDVEGDKIFFTPESTGKRRFLVFKDLEGYVSLYNTGCRTTKQFTQDADPKANRMNSSYFLAIMGEYQKPHNLTFRKPKLTRAEETEKDAVVKARKGQGRFREDLLEYWNNTCAVTGVSDKKLLRASHIKPWKDSSNSDRLNEFNGLLLTPNLDALFDQGLITFDDNGKITVSKKITGENLKKLGVRNSMSLRKIDKKHQPFLAYHRDNIFK